jgi:hypothetical protein
VTPVLIFDSTAIVALLDAHPRMLDLVEFADAGDVTILLPACAVAEANVIAQGRPTILDWLLLVRGVIALDLTVHTALETARHEGSLPTRQVIHAGHTYAAEVVTNEPGRYPPDSVALAVF